MMKGFAAILVMTVLTACGSTRTSYYTLAPIRAESPVSRSCITPPISLRRTSLPGMLDRDSVVRVKSATMLVVSSDDRWASPLDAMIQDVLAQDLRQRLGPHAVRLPGDIQPAQAFRQLAVNITRFAGDASGRVTLQADWALTRNGDTLVTGRPELIDVPSSGRATEAVVRTMSVALGRLSDRIAQVLRDCPKSARD